MRDLLLQTLPIVEMARDDAAQRADDPDDHQAGKWAGVYTRLCQDVDAIRAVLVRVGKRECPKCKSLNVEELYHVPDHLPECNYLACEDCSHQWDHA